MIRSIPRNAEGTIRIINEKGVLIATTIDVAESGDIVIIGSVPGTVVRKDEGNVYIEFPDETEITEIRKITEAFEELTDIARIHEIDEKDVTVLLGLFV